MEVSHIKVSQFLRIQYYDLVYEFQFQFLFTQFVTFHLFIHIEYDIIKTNLKVNLQRLVYTAFFSFHTL